MQVVRVSGTIRKAEEEAIRRARLHIKRAQRLGGETGILPLPTSGAGASTEADEDGDLDMANGIEDPDGPGDDEDEDG